MNLSSRWCVTAVVALGAIGCSDPVPPAARGAIWVNIQAASPAPSGKSCPSGTSSTFDVPHVDPSIIPSEVLDDDTYLHRIIDGQNQSSVSCTVRGGSTFEFSGRISGPGAGGKGTLEISNGTLDASHKGTATILVYSAASLSQSLTSPTGACTIDASDSNGNHEVEPGVMWASFTCSSVEAQPSDYCKAHGVFVLENCAK